MRGEGCAPRRGRGLPQDYWVPLLLQFAVLFLAISVHGFFTVLGSMLQPATELGGEVTRPTTGRFIYMLAALTIGLVLTALACGLPRKKHVRDGITFWLGIAAGTLLWQALGEDSWHFGVLLDGKALQFARLESASALFMFIGLAALLLCTRNDMDFGMRVSMLCFFYNWLGHFVMIGTYPFASAWFAERAWNLLSGGIAGTALTICGLYRGIRRAEGRREQLLASMMTYIGLGIIALAILEG